MPRRSPKTAARASANAKLAGYLAKRDFARTPEPPPRVASSDGNAYLIQKHAARRLHYDLRLELDGVLKSWAVTRGPSLDPADRRLAVHVEDHPLAYGDFEGVIPQGQYGGGTVMIWDRGTWEPAGDPHAGYAAGKLKFLLKGKRLKGRWTLVRMRGRTAQEGRDNWLLIKERDRYARPGAGDALTARAGTSAVSGKTMEQIASHKRVKTWQPRNRTNPAPSVGTKRQQTKTPDPSRLVGTRRGVLWQPSFQGLHGDKPAMAIHHERPASAPRRRVAAITTRRTRLQSSAKRPNAPAMQQHTVAGVVISHPDREVFPGMGITKERLAEYYRAVAEWILPEIAERPLSLLRCPTGTGGQCFFQKHFTTGMKSLDRVAIREASGTAEYLVVHNVRDLVAMIQEGIVEIHPWGALADDPDKPDRMILDLDPAPDVAFERVIETALGVRDLLAEFGLASFAKTTGGKGLHVVVPLRRGVTWPALKSFARGIAETFAHADAARYTTTAFKQSRGGKIFIDYLRNDRGSTAVAGYSVRARDGAPVAFPLVWSEVRRGLDPKRYSVTTVPRLLATRRDPWRALYRLRQSIPTSAFEALGVG
ncbi:MAG: non-homologous end-joining DNA ligase [Alphaproteobacteria bacterium]|nr:non-homologous end-joining DNA ligase [Alphaproteobacteria bacterium]